MKRENHQPTSDAAATGEGSLRRGNVFIPKGFQPLAPSRASARGITVRSCGTDPEGVAAVDRPRPLRGSATVSQRGSATGSFAPRIAGNRFGFTLIEILTVIVIIGILAGLSIPAIGFAVRKGKQTAQKAELSSLSQAIEQYAQKYGDYPPDGSNAAVLNRHMRKLFPRVTEPDITLLARLTDGSSATGTTGTFNGVAMDRAEALVFFLGGFSGDTQLPLTGPGGPLDYIGPANPTLAQRQDLANYQYNATRDNSFFDFEPARLTIRRASETAPLLSSDELDFGYQDSGFLKKLSWHGGYDLLPAYLAVEGELAPIVYFDSRTYGAIETSTTPATYNGYIAPNVGGIRPYKTEFAIEPPAAGGSYGSEATAFSAIKFQNANTFQIVSPGLDGLFGSIVDTGGGTANPVHFVTETGRPVWPNVNATTISQLYFTNSNLGSKGYQDRDWDSDGDGVPEFSENGHLDNITNFSQLTLEGDLND